MNGYEIMEYHLDRDYTRVWCRVFEFSGRVAERQAIGEAVVFDERRILHGGERDI